MKLPRFSRLPQHIGIIPDGNRRWAQQQGFAKQDGYDHGIDPGLQLYELALQLGIPELTFYGFTNDNTKRPPEQRVAFQQACVKAVQLLSHRDASLLVVGNDQSPMFPPQLKPYIQRQVFGENKIKLNFLVNYDWQWDLSHAFLHTPPNQRRKDLINSIASADISRIDLIIRWGGRSRLSGLLPVQAVYADMHVIDDYWPNFTPQQFFNALRWYAQQDITLGG